MRRRTFLRSVSAVYLACGAYADACTGRILDAPHVLWEAGAAKARLRRCAGRSRGWS
jgi:hypothetical protein